MATGAGAGAADTIAGAGAAEMVVGNTAAEPTIGAAETSAGDAAGFDGAKELAKERVTGAAGAAATTVAGAVTPTVGMRVDAIPS